MRLELQILKVGKIQFGDCTSFSAGILTVNLSELQELLLQDPRLREIEIELAHPGEKCRILKVLDVVEPRAKTSPGSSDYPGVVGVQAPAGTGTTCVLKGAAVVLADFRERREVSTSSYPNGEIIDMFGPGAEASTFGKTCNVVLLPTPSEGVTPQEYMAALKVAGLKTSAYLARAGKGNAPDETEVFELPALTGGTKPPGRLPKIVYIFQIQTLQFEPIAGEPVLYGRNVPDMVPTLIHPNEVLDGAVTSALPALNVQTYHVQNHSMIRELYKRHGKELTFAAVIITLAPNNVADIERVSNISANLAKYVVGAEGALLTKTGGGAPELTMARTAQRCEQLGVKTAIALLHMGADISDAKYGATTIFSMPEVDAIVSMGVPFMELELPAADRIIGRADPVQEGPPVQEAMVRSIRWIKGSQCQLGSSKLKAVRY